MRKLSAARPETLRFRTATLHHTTILRREHANSPGSARQPSGTRQPSADRDLGQLNPQRRPGPLPSEQCRDYAAAATRARRRRTTLRLFKINVALAETRY